MSKVKAPVAQSVEWNATGNGRSQVQSRAATYQSCSTSCSSLGTQSYMVELGMDDLVSG